MMKSKLFYAVPKNYLIGFQQLSFKPLITFVSTITSTWLHPFIYIVFNQYDQGFLKREMMYWAISLECCQKQYI